MKTYAINHTQNKAYCFKSKEDAEIWLEKFTNNGGKAQLIDKKDNTQFLSVYKDILINIKLVLGLGGFGFVIDRG